MSFKPKILGFLCNWCSYAGADLAGVSRIQYPPNIRVIRVMCSGRVDPKFIFEALQLGIDGVIVMGCHPGDCHYLEGNYEAEKKFQMVLKFLSFIGFENRVRLEWVSASEGTRYGEVVKEFTAQITEVGPSPLSGENPDQDLLDKIKAIEEAAASERMRSLVGRQRKITEEENVYGEVIFLCLPTRLEKESKSVKDLGKELKIDPSIVLEHMLVLKTRSQVDFQEIIVNTPVFMRINI